MPTLQKKHILIGITGSIAAYKIADLIRALKHQSAVVKVIMTRSASMFITATTVQTLSQEPVYTDEWLNSTSAAMDHISLARWADLILVAPASADTLARLAAGQANDLLSTTCLASTAPILIAPAMNQAMWHNAFVQDNIAKLKKYGIKIIPPGEGEQACGDVGQGRLPDLDCLISEIYATFSLQLLKNKHVLITAGPTHEAIDPVRYLTNRSSGKMGYALARAAFEQGALVTLISGPCGLPKPYGVNFIATTNAKSMFDAVMEAIHSHAQQKCVYDLSIFAAAVTDYRPLEKSPQKIKKSQQNMDTSSLWNLSFTVNPDILATVTELTLKPAIVVGFSAETEQLLENAQKKLVNKRLDMIIANPVGDDQGFETDDNCATVLDKTGHITSLDRMSKPELARKLIRLIHEYSNSKHNTA